MPTVSKVTAPIYVRTFFNVVNSTCPTKAIAESVFKYAANSETGAKCAPQVRTVSFVTDGTVDISGSLFAPPNTYWALLLGMFNNSVHVLWIINIVHTTHLCVDRNIHFMSHLLLIFVHFDI